MRAQFVRNQGSKRSLGGGKIQRFFLLISSNPFARFPGADHVDEIIDRIIGYLEQKYGEVKEINREVLDDYDYYGTTEFEIELYYPGDLVQFIDEIHSFKETFQDLVDAIEPIASSFRSDQKIKTT